MDNQPDTIQTNKHFHQCGPSEHIHNILLVYFNKYRHKDSKGKFLFLVFYLDMISESHYMKEHI